MKNRIFSPNTEISKARQMTVTALMGAMSAVLMYIQIPLPMFMPSFIRFDLSELPALIAAFAIGPLSGVCVCLIKCIVALTKSYSGGIGELSNFLLGCSLVIPAGLIYKAKKTKAIAAVGALVGTVTMALVSIATNYFIVYPIYVKLGLMTMDEIISAYKLLNSNVETLLDALVWFNMPFNFVKGLVSSGITMAIYKHISPVLKHGQREPAPAKAK